jgi:alpha-mannosidase
MNLIGDAINKLFQLGEVSIHANWYYWHGEVDNIDRLNFDNWQRVSLNEKGYITFDRGRQVCWLAQKIVVPSQLQNYPLSGLNLRLCLTWWAEDAKVFVDGKLIAAGDLFDSTIRLLLSGSVECDQEFIVAIRLVSPQHDIGALMQSRCIYESDYIADAIDPCFVANELKVVKKYLENFAPDRLDILKVAIKNIAWDKVENRSIFDRSLQQLRKDILPFSNIIKERNFSLLGHAHLDMAWLWEVPETWIAAQNTFTSVLNLQQDFSQLTFCHSSPALYEWIEQNRPDLFASIQIAVKQEKWEVVGGMWIEPEVNIIGGESIVRQLLYGQNYFQAKFDNISKIVWLPDSFGFTWQLPQLLKQAGIDYFVTGKLHWNDTTKFPYGCFNWESPDGTQLFTSMLPPCVAGVMDTNPDIMTDYSVDWEKQTGLKDIFWIPGVGDHGGGPSKDMLEVGERWQNSPFFPQIQFTKAEAYLKRIENQLTDTPVWRDELYLEFHRGCYTTHAEQKRFNRQCENLLYRTELYATIACLLDEEGVHRTHSFPTMNDGIKHKKTYQECQAKIETIWKKVLFNQFHDILPGTSITEVFTKANRTWCEAIAMGEKILQEALESIVDRIVIPAPPLDNAKPVVIFNPLNWQRSEYIALPLSDRFLSIYDSEGGKIPSQILASGQEIIFLANDIPSVGYKLFWLVAGDIWEEKQNTNPTPIDYILENELIRVEIDRETGSIASIFDKLQGLEILRDAGNQLQAFTDKGQYWDAWNIDPNYQQHLLEPLKLKLIEYLDFGELQQTIHTVLTINDSTFTQDYILQQNSPILTIKTTVDWQETHILIKASFPLNLEADTVNYEIPCATIQRTTKPETEADKAKWEVPALRWADLTDLDRNYGISLLNDCKYGYDANFQQLRLTLLRSPRWPDAEADKGIHHFTYAIYPHQGDWKEARTVRKGYELNLPLQALVIDEIATTTERFLPTTGNFIDLGSENLILMAFKRAETDGFILRCYEAHGEKVEWELENSLGLTIDDRVDLLEQSINKSSAIEPWQVVSFKLHASALNNNKK